LRDQRLGPYQVIEKVGLKSYRLKLPQGCRLHPVFHRDLLSKASTSTPLRHRPAKIESDQKEYAIDFISDVKVDNWPSRRGPYLHLPMVEIYYNCSINESSKHYPFEVTYCFQPATLAHRLLPLTSAPAPVADRLTELANDRDVVRELLTLSKQRMVTCSSRPTPTSVVGEFVFLSSKGLHIHSQKCKHLRDQRLGPYQVIEKVGLKSYRLKLPQGCRLHPVFHCDLLSKASTFTPLRHRPTEVESDHNEYAIDFISDVKVDNWPSRRGPYFQFLTHFVGYDVHKWMLLEQVDDCEHLSVFLSSDVWARFSQTQSYMQIKTRRHHDSRERCS
jgi:hypothetical protein